MNHSSDILGLSLQFSVMLLVRQHLLLPWPETEKILSCQLSWICWHFTSDSSTIVMCKVPSIPLHTGQLLPRVPRDYISLLHTYMEKLDTRVCTHAQKENQCLKDNAYICWNPVGFYIYGRQIALNLLFQCHCLFWPMNWGMDILTIDYSHVISSFFSYMISYFCHFWRCYKSSLLFQRPNIGNVAILQLVSSQVEPRSSD